MSNWSYANSTFLVSTVNLFAHFDSPGPTGPLLATLPAFARYNLFVIIETFKTPQVPETNSLFPQQARIRPLFSRQFFFHPIEAGPELLGEHANVWLLDDVQVIARDSNLF
jgi:hypothetical protein